MPAVPSSRILRHLRSVALRQAAGGLEDAVLLERFLAERDEAAFEALVRRHGPMVFGVCRRVLGQRQDAEDAFQATFLVLACKAASVRKRGAVGSWLYGVAYRTAGKARMRQARRRLKEREAAVTEARNDNPVHDDLPRLLDLELSRLPDKYRGPVLLCDLEGASRKEAARQLGLPEGTLSSRLATARSMLAKRLTRRGLAFTSGSLSAVLVENVASACVPALLIGSTVQAAACVAAGQAVTAATSASVASLAKGVMNTMLMSKLKVPLGLILAVGLVTLGWGAYHGTRAADDPPSIKELAKAPAPEDRAKDDSVDDDIDLPVGTPLTQVRARVDKNGKLIIKTMVRGGSRLPVALGSAGGSDAVPEPAPEVTTIQIQRLDLADVKVYDSRGKKVDESDVIKLLKKETVAMASLHGEPVDPLHLRVLKEGTLVFALPAPRAPTGAGMMGGPSGPGTGGNPFGNLPGKGAGARPGNGFPPGNDTQGR